MLLINKQVSGLCKVFENGSSGNIKLSKTHLNKIRQSQGFLCRLLGPLLKTGLPTIGNVLKSLAESILILLGLTTAASATDAAIHGKMFGSVCPSDLASRVTALATLNEEITDIMK